MAIQINKENVILGTLVVLKYPLKNNYKISDWDWINGYDCWISTDNEVPISQYHKENYRMVGKVVEISEDNLTIEYCFEPYVWVGDSIPHSKIKIKYEDIEIDKEIINNYLKYNLGEKYINTSRLCGHEY